jgi:hypothetical protein
MMKKKPSNKKPKNLDLAVYQVAAKFVLGRRLCHDRGLEWPDGDFAWMASREVQRVMDEVRPYVTGGLTAVWLTCLYEEGVSVHSERAEDLLVRLYQSRKWGERHVRGAWRICRPASSPAWTRAWWSWLM